LELFIDLIFVLECSLHQVYMMTELGPASETSYT